MQACVCMQGYVGVCVCVCARMPVFAHMRLCVRMGVHACVCVLGETLCEGTVRVREKLKIIFRGFSTCNQEKSSPEA